MLERVQCSWQRWKEDKFACIDKGAGSSDRKETCSLIILYCGGHCALHRVWWIGGGVG